VYSKDQDMGCFILSVNNELEDCTEIVNTPICVNNEFEVVCGKCILMELHPGKVLELVSFLFHLLGKNCHILLYYNLKLILQIMFVNMKLLVLGLETTRKLKIVNLIVYGDVELIVKQIKQIYQAKLPRMRAYINLVWDLIENLFLTFNIHAIPRHENQQVDSLAVEASTFKPPDVPKLKYEVEMRQRPSIHDNVKH
jgi:hypothetical protein